MVDSPTASRGGARGATDRARTKPRQSRVNAQRAPDAPLPGQAAGVRTLITRARSSLLASFDTELEPFGVTGAQFEVLKNLARSQAETAASLCRALYADTGSMTRMLDRLEQKGLVRRERAASDRRLVLLRLTPAGESLLPRIRAAARRALRRHLAGFTSGEVEILKRLLGRIVANGPREVAEGSR